MGTHPPIFEAPAHSKKAELDCRKASKSSSFSGQAEAPVMPEWVCEVDNKDQLDNEIRKIAALENVGRGDEIYGSMTVHYSDEAVKGASLIPWLQARGVAIRWHKKSA
jgi:hypothetical protein